MLKPAFTCFGHGSPLRDTRQLVEFVERLPASAGGDTLCAALPGPIAQVSFLAPLPICLLTMKRIQGALLNAVRDRTGR